MKPIIMGAESVRAILDGRKTMTRRVVNPKYKQDEFGFNVCTNKETGEQWVEKADEDGGDFEDGTRIVLCPYGKVGDRLWVREEWKPGAWSNDGRVAIDYRASPELTHTPWICMEDQADNYIPRWLNEISEIGLIPNQDGRYEWEPGKSPFKWKRAMYMPRFASRIILEITDIRVERVQDITEEDALKEGFHNYGTDVDTLDAFCEVWQKLNAKRGYPWESNPLVWCLEFKKIDK